MYKTMTLILAGLGLTLAACGSATAAKEHTDADPKPTLDEPAEEADLVVEVNEHDTEGSSIEFVVAMVDGGMTDDTDDLGDHFMAIAGYAEDFDIDGMLGEARDARTLLDELRDDARDLPGADSETGKATIEAFDICYGAMDTTVDALDDFDIDGLTVSTDEMAKCTDAVEDATATIPG